MNKIQLSTTQPQTYFKIYCFNMFLCGLMVSSFGPIIPYLSEYLNRSETQFSFLFVARTVGSLIACFLYKYIRKVQQQTFNDHKILSLCNGIIAIFALLFSQWLSVFGEWVEVIAIGGAYYFVITGVNILILVISNNKRHGWMPFSSGMFGVGALTSPQIIRFFQLDLYLIICFLFLCCSALNYHFPTPNKGGTHEQKKQQLKYKEGTLAQQIVISCSFFLIVGIQMTVSGWIPSYAVLSVISDKAQATIYITIFWAMSTTFRFIASALHTKLSIKIKTLVISILSTSTICIILHQNEAYGIAALFGSAFYGISCSAVYPTLFSLSTQFGIKFRPQQTANMMLSTVLSYGILVAMVGKFMKTNINSLFYSLFGMSLLLCVAVFYVLYLLRRQSDLQIAKETQLEQILVQ